MRLRKRLLFPLVALLGAAVAVLPALAASSAVELEINKNCVADEWPCWTSSSGPHPPPASVTTIAEGGVITFSDRTSVATNIAWVGAAPTCSSSVPVSPMPAQAGWEGACTFERAGHYKFEGTGLYFAYTKYEIVVEAAGGATSTGTGTTTTGSSSSGDTGSGPGSSTQSGGQTPTGTPLASPFAGGESAAVKLAAAQRGASVHGSVDLSPAAAGGRLEVALLARGASLASAGRSSRVLVGRVTHASLRAGIATFTVALDARARHALRVHGQLALSVRIVLRPAQGAAVTITRNVVLRG